MKTMGQIFNEIWQEYCEKWQMDFTFSRPLPPEPPEPEEDCDAVKTYISDERG